MSTLKISTLSNIAATKTIPIGTVVDGSAKAWVNFNGQGVVAGRATFNIASITDNGVGDYYINFGSAMPDTLYAAVGSSASDGSQRTDLDFSIFTTTSVRVTVTVTTANTVTDSPIISAVIYR